MDDLAADVYFAQIAEGARDPRARWRRWLEAVVTAVIDESPGGGGYVVSVRLVADPTKSWLDLGPLTRREAPGLLSMVRNDLAALSRADFEAKYRLREVHAPRWPL